MDNILLEKIEKLEAENREIKSLLLEIYEHFNISKKPKQNIIDLKTRAKMRAIQIQSKNEYQKKG